jgi:glycerophosphoryl diester phosphodiesterase
VTGVQGEDPGIGDRVRVLVLAHRGDWLEGDDPKPQNSVDAVLAALEAEADGAEVDTRLSADGAVVLHHDAEIGPSDVKAGCAAPVGTPLCELTAAELGHLNTLAELLDALERRADHDGRDRRHLPVVLNIELKDLPGEPGWDAHGILARRVAQSLASRRVDSWLSAPSPRPELSARPPRPEAQLARSSVQVIVSSFDPASLDQFRVHAPAATTALLLDQGDDWRAKIARARGLSAVNPAETMAQPEFFAEASCRGLAVVPWTVDAPGRAAELAELGAVALITNMPRAVRRALRRAV